jgi:hypothetical protein
VWHDDLSDRVNEERLGGLSYGWEDVNREFTEAWLEAWSTPVRGASELLGPEFIELVPAKPGAEELTKALLLRFRECLDGGDEAQESVLDAVMAARQELGVERLRLHAFLYRVKEAVEIPPDPRKQKKASSALPGRRPEELNAPEKALAAYEAAASSNPESVELAGQFGKKTEGLRELHAWLVEHPEAYPGMEVPSFDSWTRYLREVHEHGQEDQAPGRVGGEGATVKRQDDLSHDDHRKLSSGFERNPE